MGLSQAAQSVHQLPLCSVALSIQSSALAGKWLAGAVQKLRLPLLAGLITPAMWPEAPITKRFLPLNTWVLA